MRIKSAGKNATLVLLNARASSVRVLDALSIRRFIAGDEAQPVKASLRARDGSPIIKASLHTRGGKHVKARRRRV
jgi:D-alanyl-D-alanine carboxypeptidase/D-alanyl-D-alanine endopeptidase (penicillin-binding protein 7)